MDHLTDLLEALLMSLAIIGTAALDMVLMLILILAAFGSVLFVRWGLSIIWNAAVVAFKRDRNG